MLGVLYEWSARISRGAHPEVFGREDGIEYVAKIQKKSRIRGRRDHSIHITSVGPYISKFEQKNFDEQDARAKSIHPAVFKPGGLWDKWEAPPGGWGFAAAGFLLPDDLPETSKRFGSFYNTHAHQFRHTAPKKNLYM